MLPTGHIAGGYLASIAAAKIFGAELPELSQDSMIAFGAFMGFAPDLDMFYSFYRKKRMYFDENSANPEINHRHYNTHAPLLHLSIALAIFILGAVTHSPWVQAGGVMWLAGTWSHFFLDSFGYGITWLAPISSKVYSFYNSGNKISVPGRGFFQYWGDFLKAYSKRLEFYLELIVVIIALMVYL